MVNDEDSLLPRPQPQVMVRAGGDEAKRFPCPTECDGSLLLNDAATKEFWG